MHSLLFKIGPFSIHAYGLCIALGFLASWGLAYLQARRTGRRTDDFSDLLVWTMASGVIGARVAYVIENWSLEFAQNPLKMLRIDQGGLVFYGGFIGAVAVLWLFCFFKKESPLAMADFLLTLLPLGHAFGRVGCFMHGCCYGRITDSAIGICFPAGSQPWHLQVQEGVISSAAPYALPLIPTQLIEAGGNLILFGVLYGLYPRLRTRKGLTAGLYLIGYAVLRFSIEFFRADHRARVGEFSIGQFISCGLLLAGAALLVYSLKRPAETK